MTSISKNVYINKLDDSVNKYNNTYHRAIKMKPVNVKPSTYIDSSKQINDKDHKFKIDDIVRMSKYSDLKSKEIGGTFCEQELQKSNQKKLRVDKVIKKKEDKLYVKSKCYDSSFNIWIDKKTVQMSGYFPESKSLVGSVKVELNFSDYATKADAAGVDTSKFTKKFDLANLKHKVDKLGIDKLKNMPSDLSGLKCKADKLVADKLVPVPVELI